MVWKRFDFDEIPVDPGETLTIWVKGKTQWIQVEIRVLKNGTPEIFCDSQVRPFSDWYKLEEESNDDRRTG